MHNQIHAQAKIMSHKKQKELELFHTKIQAATEGLQAYLLNCFKTLGKTNGTILADYIIAARNESIISDTYKRETNKPCLHCIPYSYYVNMCR